MKVLHTLFWTIVIVTTTLGTGLAQIGTPPGSGTAVDPYRIETIFHFITFKNPANASTYWASGVYTRLDCDINLDPDLVFGAIYDSAVIAPDTDNSTPGFQGTSFLGHFDGNGHSIQNVTIVIQGADHEFLGLFGKIEDGSVKNLSVTSLDITGNSIWYMGGICGYNDGALIQKCYTSGWITDTSSAQFVGGICGYNIRGIIEKSMARVNIKTANTSRYIGGLCGFNNNGNLRKSYATGAVEGRNYLGGFCGYSNETATIENCYSTGRITGTGNEVGGFTGGQFPAGSDLFANCFWDVETSGIGADGDNRGGAIGKTTLKMYNPATFNTVWNYTTPVWYQPVYRYPQLSGMPESGLTGAGTNADPFRIFDSGDFHEFANPIFAFAHQYWSDGVYTFLSADLDLDPSLPGNKTYTTAPVAPDTDSSETGFQGTPYLGIFNGQNYSINNMTIDPNGVETSYLGLFGQVGSNSDRNAVIKFLGMKNININVSSSWGVGGICGRAYNANIEGCYTTGIIKGDRGVGGLCGDANQAIFRDCYSTADISGTKSCGGFIGYQSGNWALIETSYAVGSVSAAGQSQKEYFGGFCGRNNYAATIKNCYATGRVTGDTQTSYMGGFCGKNDERSIIENCYSTGRINSGSSNIGGFCGLNLTWTNPYYNATITGSFWNVNTSGMDTGGDETGGTTGKTTTEMRQSATFIDAEWDYTTTPIWHQPAGKYPQLVGLPETGGTAQIVPILNLLME